MTEKQIILSVEIAAHLEAYVLFAKESGADETACTFLREMDAKLVEKVQALETISAELVEALQSLSTECIKQAHSTKWPHVSKMQAIAEVEKHNA